MTEFEAWIYLFRVAMLALLIPLFGYLGYEFGKLIVKKWIKACSHK